jgi:hypothetical protein
VIISNSEAVSNKKKEKESINNPFLMHVGVCKNNTIN